MGKVYTGKVVDSDYVVEVDGAILKPNASFLKRHGYPGDPQDAYAWNRGYRGTAPKQLALMILLDCLGDEERAVDLHADFVEEEIGFFEGEKGWMLTEEMILETVQRIETRRRAERGGYRREHNPPISPGEDGQDAPAELPCGGVLNAMGHMARTAPKEKVVFVVHGRNEVARQSLFRFLRAIGLAPTEWSQAVARTGKATPYVGNVLDVAFSQAQAVVVLFTGDDEARLRPGLIREEDPVHERVPTPQARANVLFEAGIAFGRCPHRTVLLEIGGLRPFSDIAGRHVVRLNNSIEARQALAERLRTAGCEVDTTGSDWHHEGDFEAAILREETAAGQSQSAAVGPEPLSILEFLAGLEGGVATAGDLTANLRISYVKVEHYLDQLVDHKFIFRTSFVGGESQYGLDREGRALLVKMGKV